MSKTTLAISAILVLGLILAALAVRLARVRA